MLLTPAQIKLKSFELRRNSSFFSLFFLPGVDAPRVCLGARLLPLSYQYPNLSDWRALTASLDSCAEIKECPIQWRN